LPRPKRYIPKGGCLVETCTRTIQARMFLRPDKEFLEILYGVLGRALEYAGVELHGFHFMGNHYHLLYWVENALQMAVFQWYFNNNLAKETARLRDWPDKIWARRYVPMIVSDDPEDQWDRLKYVLANATKAQLVESPYDWPGTNAAKALVYDELLEGTWFNRTEEYEATRRGEEFEKYDYATKYQVELAPLPGFRHLSAEDYRAKVAGLIEEIEQEAAAVRGDQAVMGVGLLLLQHPHHRPRSAKKSPAPLLLYAKDPEKWAALADDYAAFNAQCEVAKDLMFLSTSQRGSSNPCRHFPEGCFPPAMPFVGATAPWQPLPPMRRLELLEVGNETTVIRGPIPVVFVPGRGRKPGPVACSPRTASARASPGPDCGSPPT
jgi:hypothetical protein